MLGKFTKSTTHTQLDDNNKKANFTLYPQLRETLTQQCNLIYHLLNVCVCVFAKTLLNLVCHLGGGCKHLVLWTPPSTTNHPRPRAGSI